MENEDKLVYVDNSKSLIDYGDMKMKIDTLYGLICRNKTDRILTPEEFSVIDKLYESLKWNYERLTRLGEK